MGALNDSIYAKGYKPLSTVINNQAANPNARPIVNIPTPDLSATSSQGGFLSSEIKALQTEMQAFNQPRVAERLARTANVQQLNQMVNQGGATGAAAAARLDGMGVIPKVNGGGSVSAAAVAGGIVGGSVVVGSAAAGGIGLGGIVAGSVALGVVLTTVGAAADAAKARGNERLAKVAYDNASAKVAQAQIDQARIGTPPDRGRGFNPNPPPSSSLVGQGDSSTAMGGQSPVQYQIAFGYRQFYQGSFHADHPEDFVFDNSPVLFGAVGSPQLVSLAGGGDINGVTIANHDRDHNATVSRLPLGVQDPRFTVELYNVRFQRADGFPDSPYVSPAPSYIPSYQSSDYFPYPPVLVNNGKPDPSTGYTPQPQLAAKPSNGSNASNPVPFAPSTPSSAIPVSPLGNSSPAYALPSAATSASPSTVAGANTSGFISTPATQTPANSVPITQPTVKNPGALKQPLIQPTPAPTPKPTPNTPTPPSPDTGLIITLLGAAAIGATAIKDRIDQVYSNTTPSQQQANVAEGVCQSVQEGQCGFEGIKNAATQATNPIKDIANENKGLLANIIAAIANLLTILNTLKDFVFDKIGKILNLLNNQVVDRAVNLLNLAVNITNLLMLTESAGKALGSIVDAVFSLTPLHFENSAGQKTTASTAFGQNVTAMIVNIIGVDNYASLKEELAVGNRIIKSVTNGLNQTTRLLNMQSKQQQKTGIDVANIGRALVANNVVNQNSYPPMSNSPDANAAMPLEDTNIIQGRLGVIKQGIAGLRKITATINSNVRAIKGIQKSFKDVSDLVDGDSKARKTIRNTAKTEAVRKAKFTSLNIKSIKAKK
jgi:hypothetical protein